MKNIYKNRCKDRNINRYKVKNRNKKKVKNKKIINKIYKLNKNSIKSYNINCRNWENQWNN
jgi:hypothetical protein